MAKVVRCQCNNIAFIKLDPKYFNFLVWGEFRVRMIHREGLVRKSVKNAIPKNKDLTRRKLSYVEIVALNDCDSRAQCFDTIVLPDVDGYLIGSLTHAVQKAVDYVCGRIGEIR